MRKSAKEAANTRARIVATAAEKFREDGIVATGLNGLMGAAGLTHGGFYKHFASKDQLVAEVCSHLAHVKTGAMVEQTMSAPESERLAVFIRAYLSRSHRDEPGSGCGFAALASEMGRMGPEVRRSGRKLLPNSRARSCAWSQGSRGPRGKPAPASPPRRWSAPSSAPARSETRLCRTPS